MCANRVPRITDLFIHPDYRLKGFGRQAVRARRALGAPAPSAKLEWFVENMNMTAQYLFDRVDGAAQTGFLGYTLPLEDALSAPRARAAPWNCQPKGRV